MNLNGFKSYNFKTIDSDRKLGITNKAIPCGDPIHTKDIDGMGDCSFLGALSYGSMISILKSIVAKASVLSLSLEQASYYKTSLTTLTKVLEELRNI